MEWMSENVPIDQNYFSTNIQSNEKSKNNKHEFRRPSLNIWYIVSLSMVTPPSGNFIYHFSPDGRVSSNTYYNDEQCDDGYQFPATTHITRTREMYDNIPSTPQDHYSIENMRALSFHNLLQLKNKNQFQDEASDRTHQNQNEMNYSQSFFHLPSMEQIMESKNKSLMQRRMTSQYSTINLDNKYLQYKPFQYKSEMTQNIDHGILSQKTNSEQANTQSQYMSYNFPNNIDQNDSGTSTILNISSTFENKLKEVKRQTDQEVKMFLSDLEKIIDEFITENQRKSAKKLEQITKHILNCRLEDLINREDKNIMFALNEDLQAYSNDKKSKNKDLIKLTRKLVFIFSTITRFISYARTRESRFMDKPGNKMNEYDSDKNSMRNVKSSSLDKESNNTSELTSPIINENENNENLKEWNNISVPKLQFQALANNKIKNIKKEKGNTPLHFESPRSIAMDICKPSPRKTPISSTSSNNDSPSTPKYSTNNNYDNDDSTKNTSSSTLKTILKKPSQPDDENNEKEKAKTKNYQKKKMKYMN